MIPEFHYCMHCGAKLEEKYLESEGKNIPWCPSCRDYRFPVFNTAVSMIVLNEAEDRVLMIRQYGGEEFILTAGYVNKGEDAEDAAVREIREELGLETVKVRFNRSHYFPPSNTLMLNFVAVVRSTEAHINEEVDQYRWFTKEDARKYIRKNSLAKAFLTGWLDGVFTFPEYPAKPYK